MCDVTRFGCIKGKLTPRYVGSFKIVERISDVAYRLNFPPSLSHVHDVFHVSMLKYTPNPSHILLYADIPLQPDVTYKNQPAEILARKIGMFWELESEISEK